MPLEIVRNDITAMKVDAIVNAANNSLLGGGGVDGAIHRAAGPELLRECRGLNGCATGDAKLTGAYRLPCKYVIHTVGPVWNGGENGERELLASCYRRSLELAIEHDCETVAFPLISSGVYGYPKDQALKTAVDTIGDFLLERELTVYLVIFDRAAYQIGEKLFSDIAAYIDDTYVDNYGKWLDGEKHRRELSEKLPMESSVLSAAPPAQAASDPAPQAALKKKRRLGLFRPKEELPESGEAAPAGMESFSETVSFSETASFALPAEGLDKALAQLDESFSEMLLRKIDEKGMTDAQCYKKANIDRKLFSKIRSDIHYKPSKSTALAFAIALELPLSETNELLRKAGFALSHSNKFDIIVEYFIRRGNYNVYEINEALFAFDQNLLGA